MIQRALNQPASRWLRFMRELVVDVALVGAALFLTFALTTNFEISPQGALTLLWWSAFLGIIATGAMMSRGLYWTHPRYIGLHDFLNIVITGGVLTLAQLLLQLTIPNDLGSRFMWATPVLFGLTCTGLLSTMRIAYRHWAWRTSRQAGNRARTLVVGAGDAGELIVREIQRSTDPKHEIIGFADDDPSKFGMRIHGHRVLGTTEQIPAMVDHYQVQEVLLAIPRAHGKDVKRIYDICSQTSVRVRTLPAVTAVLQGDSHISHHLREVEIEDLLRREPVKTDLKQIAGYIEGEHVLVTGGGGSIGGELGRQIARLSPASLVITGKGENSIYEIEQELLQTSGFRCSPVIADVRDRASMERVFANNRPSVVFHAAAHKHVPLMQSNPIEAIRNNIFGTWTVADLAVRNGAQKFILVSTDKAVNPSSVMGATKRVAEMIVTSWGRMTDTEFGIVRFGNVLGSRGSLVPMLKAQIKRGGPLRITHPGMTRYFMTIPEAVQLILQAGAMCNRSEIFILDMGEPVKIMDLAKELIRLHGLTVDQDIKIEIVGIRPGEKMHEELMYDREKLEPTQHPKIRLVHDTGAPEWSWLRQQLDTLRDICDSGNQELAKNMLMELAWGKKMPFLPPTGTSSHEEKAEPL